MTGTGRTPAARGAPCEPFGRLPFAAGPAAFLLLASGLIWLVPAWFDRRALAAMLLWDGLVLAAAVLDFHRTAKPRDLTVTRRWSGPLTLGSPAQVSLDLHNAGAGAVTASVMDYAPASMRANAPDVRVHVRAGAVAAASYEVAPAERGDAEVGSATVRWLSAWRLCERRGIAPIGQTVRVYPDVQRGRRESLYLIRSRQIAIEKRRARHLGQGREFESLRDHQDGDEPRDVCWTATARRGRLVTKIYRPERSQPVWLIVDLGRLLRARAGAFTMLDHAVTGALTLAQVAMASGDNVGLLAYGRRIQRRLPPGRGSAQLRALIEALASVRAESVEADHGGAAAEMLRVQKRRALVVWLTDVAETAGTPDVIDQSTSLMPRHVVLFAVARHGEIRSLASSAPRSSREMYRVLAAQEAVERRDALLGGLRQRGALVLEGAPADLGGALVDRYLEVKERGLL
ncbi:MAG: hypothetical protein A3H96_13970 [Acidobacteria bacterium RIFCSPLOWO2_02_FULL_67_36]|nr:MAG: hypothetical protein A3H96_13970 [Acidobacteria bacterium RIFCSPLOWO2_02_FULL_67_36]OFW18337.1 MAG: hypothetical protein A3G21_07480 [Acidobacteria bacterium RIFCSPLOWO2_12_FULL_66_21]